MEERTCRLCGAVKTIDQFKLDPKKKDGVNCCRPCFNAWQRENRAKAKARKAGLPYALPAAMPAIQQPGDTATRQAGKVEMPDHQRNGKPGSREDGKPATRHEDEGPTEAGPMGKQRKVTVRLPVALVRRLKVKAAQTDQTINGIVEAALVRYLEG